MYSYTETRPVYITVNGDDLPSDYHLSFEHNADAMVVNPGQFV